MPRKARSESESAARKPDRRRKEYRMRLADDLSEADLIPGAGTAVPGRPETADALAQLHQYDDSADGIGILE